VADVNSAGERLKGTIGGRPSRRARETWQAIEREIDFGDVACGADVADAERECWVELGWIDEIEERALGVDAGDDGFGGDFFAVGENDCGDGVIFDADVLDVGLRADFGAGSACGFG